MHKLNVLVIAAALASGVVSGTAAAGGQTITSGRHHDDIANDLSDTHYSMFDGVRLTEQQRQQMRDLMSQERLGIPYINVSETERLHTLVTAEKFDEPAVRAQMELIAQQDLVRQVHMAKIRNQMYNLLTPEQRHILDEKHQQRIAEIKLRMLH
ncbi:cell-envelope stress modulator CpxP [Acerihabitans sp. TG2]|uniref:cell-envelope stress modulator CpxP n=1 Tax=Acerihabitans sp. TG2 TaxID=3096008 RepID=UPI003A599294